MDKTTLIYDILKTETNNFTNKELLSKISDAQDTDENDNFLEKVKQIIEIIDSVEKNV